jgi:hypothetical protein
MAYVERFATSSRAVESPLAEGDQGAAGNLANSLKHRAATLRTGLTTTAVRSLSGSAGIEKRKPLRFPLLPRLRLSTYKDGRATLTMKLVQKIGQTKFKC